jgi:hypothetical protein
MRLSLVTALTVGSLLLGGGTLNALAEGHEGKDHGGGSGKVEHQQQKPVTVRHDVQSSTRSNNDDDHQNVNRDREKNDRDDDDLVTPPARVTDNVRPCDDRKHDDDCRERNGNNNDNHEDENQMESDD